MAAPSSGVSGSCPALSSPTPAGMALSPSFAPVATRCHEARHRSDRHVRPPGAERALMPPHRGLWYGIATGVALTVFVLGMAMQLIVSIPTGTPRALGLALGLTGVVLGLLLGGKVREE